MSAVLTSRRTLTVRQATVSDIAALMELVRSHWPQLPWGHLPIDEDRILRLFLWGMTSEQRACWVADDDGAVAGFIGMMLEEHPVSGQMMAREAWWFVDPQARGRVGLRLLRAAEAWARDHQVPIVVSFHDPALSPMMSRLGYRVTDYTYQKGQ